MKYTSEAFGETGARRDVSDAGYAEQPLPGGSTYISWTSTDRYECNISTVSTNSRQDIGRHGQSPGVQQLRDRTCDHVLRLTLPRHGPASVASKRATSAITEPALAGGR